MQKLTTFTVLIIALLGFKCAATEDAYHKTVKGLIIKAKYKIQKQNFTPCTKSVKVVYFHGSDKKPLRNWHHRLNNVLNDVSNYYAEEFARFGVKSEGIPFEMDSSGIKIHVVKGDLQSLKYNTKSGGVIEREIARKTGDAINFSKDFVLIINGLSYKDKNGVYQFHSPYHGRGSKYNGVCHVADCELLDSELLSNKILYMTFSEMMVKNMRCSVAEFNSWYIGGIAHEMGHVFGLPHDFGNKNELSSNTISLMGQFGSRHFRDYLWQGDKSAHFSAAGIFQLLSHPLFSKQYYSDKNLYAKVSGLQINKVNNQFVLKAKYKSNNQPYGVVALVRKLNQNSYFNRSWLNSVESGEASLNFGMLKDGKYNFSIMMLFTDGSISSIHKSLDVNNGNAVVKEVIKPGGVDVTKLYKKIKARDQSPRDKVKIDILKDIISSSKPQNLSTSKADSLYLSDAEWQEAHVGWDKVARNYFSLEKEYKFFLELNGELYPKGLYAHSPALHKYKLNKQWKTFKAIVGLRDGAHMQGSARFIVLGDGKKLYESSVLRKGQQESFNIDISGVDMLELKTEGTEGHNHNSWAIWVSPVVIKK